jgi:hypothetical protein
MVKNPERRPSHRWGDDGGVHWSQVAVVQVEGSVVMINCNATSYPLKDQKCIEYIAI